MNPLWPGLALALVLFLVWFTGRLDRSRPHRPAAVEPSALRPLRREGLCGGLAQMPMTEVFQYLATTGASGTLTVSSGRRQGSVQFGRGRIVDARFRRQEGIDALSLLMALEHGDFHFDAGAHPAQLPHGVDVLELVMSWMETQPQGDRP